MGKVFLALTMSLDGFVARPDINIDNPLGTDGEQIHNWMFVNPTDADKAVGKRAMSDAGSVIAGNHTTQLGLDTGWKGKNPFTAPLFVLSHHVPEKSVEGLTYVTDGIESALAKAKAAAEEKDVWIMGGAGIAQQFLKANLIDELRVTIAPVLFSKGSRLFEHIGDQIIQLEQIDCVQTPGATHLVYRIQR